MSPACVKIAWTDSECVCVFVCRLHLSIVAYAVFMKMMMKKKENIHANVALLVTCTTSAA